MKSHILILTLLASSTAFAAAPFGDPQWVPLSPVEKAALADDATKLHDNPLRYTPYDIQRPREPRRHEVFIDRTEYLADDPVAHALITFIGDHPTPPASAKIVVEIAQGDKVVATQTLSPLVTPKVAMLIDVGSLAPGDYVLRARLDGVETPHPIKPRSFKKSAEKHAVVEFPKDGVPLRIVTQSPVTGAVEWPITTGIPLPRGIANEPNQFVLLEDNRPVPALFTNRATWYPDGKQLKWLGLSFQAKFANGKPSEYRVVRAGAAAPTSLLKLTETPDLYTVDTGKIRFTVNRKRFGGVEQAWLTNPDGSVAGDPLIDGGNAGAFLIDERGYRFEAANDEAVKVEIEEQGPARIVIHATGWYTSKEKNERLCIFHTRLSAVPNQPTIDISHRTIITYDTDKQKLGGLGFVVNHAGASAYRFGADGAELKGDFPRRPGRSRQA